MGGCGAKPGFPIGIYSVTDSSQLARLREDGFDSFFADCPRFERCADLAQEARRRGMRMLLSPRQFWEKPSSATRGWPIAAWYLQDEPDVNNVSAGALKAMSEQTRQWDPGRPQTFVVGQGSAAQPYAQIGDFLMLDWYPVPHLKLDSVADHLDLAYSHLPKDKPLWMVIQAFDWREEPQKDPKKPRIGRFPNHSEIRFMSYSAIVHGAKGLFYFRLQRPSGRTLFDFPELWQAVTRVVREIHSLKPILEKGTPIPLPFPPATAGLEGKAWRYHGRDYVVILNRDRNNYQKIPNVLLARPWRPLFELNRDAQALLKPIDNGFYLRPYQVMVFEGPFRWR